jgi:hypothetical protein
MDNVLGMDSSQSGQDLLHGLPDRADTLVDSVAVESLQHGQNEDGISIVIDKRVLELNDVGQAAKTM